MRDFGPLYPLLLTRSHRVLTSISSWRSGSQLAGNIPILSGTITYDDTANLRRRVEITVPYEDPQNQFVWDPGDDSAHPLNYYGQRLNVRVGIGLPRGGSVWFNHGWFLIDSWEIEETDRTVSVSAVDLSQLVDDDRHYTAESPGKGFTYPQEFQRLLDGQLPFVIDGGLSTRRVNSTTVWDRDRRKNLDDLCKAWPSRWYVDDDGDAHVAAAYEQITSDTPVDAVLDWGDEGTVTGRSRSGDRERIYNAVIVTGKQAEDGSEIQPFGGAEIRDVTSPIRIQGPFGKRPKFYQSDLLTTSAQCVATAETMLTEASRIARTEPITAVPDYALELGDVAQVRTHGRYFTGRVQSIELPLTADDGAMKVTLSTIPNDDDEEEGE
ncbi:hypothetical protein ACIRJS_16555 [Streptomyces sp. NPDC102340]|uniref:hypothetical protein n=1 Tax=unclassified Streptomyces TaxID=2593676 RepID=UPI0037F7391D